MDNTQNLWEKFSPARIWNGIFNENIGGKRYINTLPLSPAKPAIFRTVDATISSSTEITLKGNTTIIRVYAISKDVYLKWGTDDVTASNFDEVVPANQIVDLVVPTGQSAINLIEREASATVIVIEK